MHGHLLQDPAAPQLLTLPTQKGGSGPRGGRGWGGLRLATLRLLLLVSSLALTACALLLAVSIARLSRSSLQPLTALPAMGQASVRSVAAASAAASAVLPAPLPVLSSPSLPSSSPALRSFLARVERGRILELPACGGNRSEVEGDFRLEAELDEGLEGEGKEQPVHVHFAIVRLCRPSLQAPTPRASFRVFITGAAFAAAAPHSTVMRGGADVCTGSLRLPDAGAVELHCKLMAHNLSATALTDDYTKQQLLPHSPHRLWRDREVQHSPLSFFVPRSAGPPSSPPLPLCFSDWRLNFTLQGRWVPGAARGEPDYRKPDLFTYHPAAVYTPYDCQLDAEAMLGDAVRRLRWLHVVGDSNGRHAFLTWCRALDGAVYNGTRERPLSTWDLPKLCSLDGGAAVLTYSHWLTHKQSVLRPHLTFGQQCSRYTEDVGRVVEQGTMYGWSHCHLAQAHIQAMQGPSLTYFLWGSHGAELGANARTLRYFIEQLCSHLHFKRFPTLFALVTDVDVSQVPAHLEAQFEMRNSERIEQQNLQLAEAVRHHWRDYPTLYEDEEGREVRGFNPLLDVFSPSYAAMELLHPDAVHFPISFELQLGQWIAHWAMHAPQTSARYRRKEGANTTLTTTEQGFIL